MDVNIRSVLFNNIIREMKAIYENDEFNAQKFIQENEQLYPQEKEQLIIINDDYKLNVLCIHCQSELFAKYSCANCIQQHIIDNFDNWNSGDKIIDTMIKYFQILYSSDPTKIIEWFPYENFKYVVKKAEGGVGSIFIASLSNTIFSWDYYNKKFMRDSQPKKVVLKSLLASNDDEQENFFKEALIHITLAIEVENLISCYGITKDPESGKFMMVLERQDDGDLRSFINNTDIAHTWREIFTLLNDISLGLYEIHKRDMIHKDLHPGNILFSNGIWKICDFGFSEPANKSSEIVGVLPYIAPEVLLERNYTSAADIYSIGIIMWQLITKCNPYGDLKCDNEIQVALEICKGRRPTNDFKLYPDYEKMMKRCWDVNISNRPSASELYNFSKENLQKIFKKEFFIPELGNNFDFLKSTHISDIFQEPKTFSTGIR
ncbi:10673_t:CDS:2 [Cetraspora pellucida]|uniref:10673_t:CDS:1 n=1 Tax=Cetraspora pellucida TaxID=1433469 RepID=A0A9N8VJP0_9GLOM|nr:10673_t:CDS:2 [Cetraspora pellucida]